MRLLFAWRQYDHSAGGVERMSIELMNEMARRGHDVHLLSWDTRNAVPYYEMDPRIKWYKLDCGDSKEKASWHTRIQRILKIRASVKAIRPDVILAFMDGIFLSVRLSTLGLGIPMIEAERCSTARFDYLKSGLGKTLVFQTLRLADRITIQLESYRNDYPVFLRNRIVCISNPVFQTRSLAKPGGLTSGNRTLLSVGRLSYQKNYAVLLRAFSRIAQVFPNWNLVIAGDGDDKDRLHQMTIDLHIQDRVLFLGTVKNVHDLYLSAHLFCLPSRWEGFPNALAEALAHGLPSVGFSGCLGVPDLITDHVNGRLAQGMDCEETLADGLAELMADDARRGQMGEQAAQSMTMYAPDRIFSQWEDLFKTLSQP